MSCYLARPRAGRFPAVVVVMEAFGLNEQIKDVARRVAAEGYVALAPDLYYREPNGVVGYDNLPEAVRLMTGLWDEKVVTDMNAAIVYLQSRDDVRADRVAVMGFCMGGRMAFLTACRNPTVRAAVSFYGGGIASVMEPSDRTPKAPLEDAESLACPVLLLFGQDDSFIPLEEVERIRARLSELHKPAEVQVYPGAPHGFFCSERDSYRAEAAGDAWRRLLEFFERRLRS